METRRAFMKSTTLTVGSCFKILLIYFNATILGENAESSEPPINHCSLQGFDELCNNMACFRCNGLREAKSETVRGTLLVSHIAKFS